MGLTSPFWKYIKKRIIQEKLDKMFIVFDYKTSLEHFDKLKFNFETSESTFTNLHICSDEWDIGNNIQFMSPLPKKKLIFSGQMKVDQINSEFKNLRVCLDNSSEAFMIVKENLNLLEKLRELVCGNPKMCVYNNDLMQNSGHLDLQITTLDREPGSKSSTLKIMLSDIVHRGDDGKLVWNIKEYTDYLNQREFTENFNSPVEDPANFPNSEMHVDETSNFDQNENLDEGRIESDLDSKTEEGFDENILKIVDQAEGMKYDYTEPVEEILTLKNSWQRKNVLWKGKKQSCDVLLGAKFMFKFNVVFEVVKSNEYPMSFQVSMGFIENRKYIQNWQIGLFYLAVSVGLAILIILFLKQSPKIREVKKRKSKKVKVD